MLSGYLERYVDGKRSLGFKFGSQAVQLRSFVAFAEERGDKYVKSARVFAWAAEAPSPEHRRNRLLIVRRFALAVRAETARHQVPGAEALGHATAKRRLPYIYNPDEIGCLLRAASALEPVVVDQADHVHDTARPRCLDRLADRGSLGASARRRDRGRARDLRDQVPDEPTTAAA